jgi:hypothetical protein
LIRKKQVGGKMEEEGQEREERELKEKVMKKDKERRRKGGKLGVWISLTRRKEKRIPRLKRKEREEGEKGEEGKKPSPLTREEEKVQSESQKNPGRHGETIGKGNLHPC